MKPEVQQIYALLEQSLGIQSHYQLLNWLQTEIQAFISHDILISVWGDFSSGIFYLDVVAIHPLLRTNNVDMEKLRPQIQMMLELWEASKMSPVSINIEDGYFDINNALRSSRDESSASKGLGQMKSCLIHGINNQRSHEDSLYLFLSDQSASEAGKAVLPILIPFIDSTFKRIAPLAEELNLVESSHSLAESQLSEREHEIMTWVKNGKTNAEIAMILDISIFTVKNHLQRIFKKLNASNRSQATFMYKALKGDG